MPEPGWYIRGKDPVLAAHFMAPADDADTHRSFLVSLCQGEFDLAAYFVAATTEKRCLVCQLMLKVALSTESKP